MWVGSRQSHAIHWGNSRPAVLWQDMGSYKNKNGYFVVWTTYKIVTDKITFDKELWESMKSNF